jgi:hypothetical protein
MVRFLVEHGACIFAATISDNETAAEKCEEDEDGYDGCSDYLYSKCGFVCLLLFFCLLFFVVVFFCVFFFACVHAYVCLSHTCIVSMMKPLP